MIFRLNQTKNQYLIETLNQFKYLCFIVLNFRKQMNNFKEISHCIILLTHYFLYKILYHILIYPRRIFYLRPPVDVPYNIIRLAMLYFFNIT